MQQHELHDPKYAAWHTSNQHKVLMAYNAYATAKTIFDGNAECMQGISDHQKQVIYHKVFNDLENNMAEFDTTKQDEFVSNVFRFLLQFLNDHKHLIKATTPKG